jgi:hypothetical protein
MNTKPCIILETHFMEKDKLCFYYNMTMVSSKNYGWSAILKRLTVTGLEG